MKITLKDGRQIEMPFPAGSTGYVATAIEIGPDDIKAMREMADRDFMNFRAAMYQLEFRFPERRAPMLSPFPDTSGEKPTIRRLEPSPKPKWDVDGR